MSQNNVVCINAAITLRKLPLLDQNNVRRRFVDDHEARELIKQQVVELLWTNKRVRALRLKDQQGAAANASKALPFVPGATGRIAQTKYSHNRENEQNPQGVWTLKHLPKSTRHIFTAVLDQNLRAVAA